MKRLSYGLMVGCTLFWGLNFVITKEGTSIFSPASFLAYRFLLAALLMALVFPGRLLRLKWGHWKAGLMIGSLLFAGTLMQAFGLRWTSASNAGFIAGLSLVFLPLIKYVFHRIPIGFKTGLSVGVALLGLASLSLKLPLQFNPGDVLILVSAAIFAQQILWVGHHAQQEGFDPIAMTWVQILGCGLLSCAYAMLAEGGISAPPHMGVWKAIAFTGILSTALTYTCQNFTQQHLEDQQVAMIFLLEPIVSCAAAIFWLSEPLTTSLVVGGCLILVAMGVSELPWERAFFRTLDRIRVKSH